MHLGAILDYPSRHLGPPWCHLGASLAHYGTILTPYWALLVTILKKILLEPSGIYFKIGLLDHIWSLLGAIFVNLDAILVYVDAILSTCAPSRPTLAPSWHFQEAARAPNRSVASSCKCRTTVIQKTAKSFQEVPKRLSEDLKRFQAPQALSKRSWSPKLLWYFLNLRRYCFQRMAKRSPKAPWRPSRSR